MTRLLPALVLVAAAGCVPAGEGDDGPVVPLGGYLDDDDDDGDRHGPIESNLAETSIGSDDFSLEPCTVPEVLGDCEELSFSPVVGEAPDDLAPGVHRFSDEAAWDETVGSAGPVAWELEDVVVAVDEGIGCSCTHEPMWVARCADDVVYVGYWFYPCGPCDDAFASMTGASVPKDADVEVVMCVPDDVRCVN